ncbi:MAG TPA: hypothetical protein VMU42_16440 [Candidatus Sulfotelmatobacter sp.]|nr:hypothetical protein [Candidatus Sulfotelmatobacter sp.]
MKRTLAITFALACAVVPLAHQTPAAAQASVTVTTPGIAFGYSDGYWDQNHGWHAWRDAREARSWRDAHRDHYYAWKHDRDRDLGWRESDRYWDRH